MSLEIEGKSGYKLDVTSRNMARVIAANMSPQFDAALNFQRAWTYSATVTPTGANDFFAYLLNGGVRDVIVTRAQASFTTADILNVQQVTGTAAGGTAISPGNRVLSSTRLPSQGVVVQGAVDITGISATNLLERLNGPAVTTVNVPDLQDRPIIVRPGSAIAFQAVSGAIAVTWMLDIIEQVIDPTEVL